MKRFNKGFTLIELLVVIAVIGVLAAIVLIAIDPLEQIRRGQDASLKDKVGQVGNAATAFFTASGAVTVAGGTPTYPTDQGEMTGAAGSGDLKTAITEVTYCASAGASAACPVAAGSCTTALPCNFVVAFAQMQSRQNISKANAGANCGAGSLAYFAFSAAPAQPGKSGLVCLAAAPTTGVTIP